LNAKTKMHSFEVDSTNQDNKGRSTSIQLLWLKNTFNAPVKIEDIT